MNPYHTPQWKQARRACLTRDNHQCQLRLPGCKGRATEADHRIDWQDGGHPYDLANLQAACKHCNISKRNTNVAARAREHRTQPTTSRTW